MGEESGNFALILIGRTTLAKARIRIQGTEKGGAGVETLPFATPGGLIDNPVEKRLRHDRRNGGTAAGGSRGTAITRTRLAAGAAVVTAGAAVAVLAAT